jgi:acetyl-CoA C-acetyltransferase
VGAQAWNIARNAWLSAGFPEEVPGVTIDRQCGSSQQAVHFAAQGVMAGVYDLAIAGGVEVMSLVTLNSSGTVGPDLGFRYPFDGDLWVERYGDQEIHQFRGGELIAEKWDVSRREMEELALSSHAKAATAWAEGRFDREVMPVGECTRDEGIRETTLEKMASLAPIREGGRLTAAVSSQITDGSAALLIASEAAIKEHGLTPRARIHHMTVVGSDAVLILTGPIPATRRAFAKTGLGPDEIDLFECNEAFASVVLAWARETAVPLEKVNVNGGAMALGHPLGASGARLMTTLVNELERRDARYGLQTMCEGGGLSNATIIERL